LFQEKIEQIEQKYIWDVGGDAIAGYFHYNDQKKG
jgi:hypothetical protein